MKKVVSWFASLFSSESLGVYSVLSALLKMIGWGSEPKQEANDGVPSQKRGSYRVSDRANSKSISLLRRKFKNASRAGKVNKNVRRTYANKVTPEWLFNFSVSKNLQPRVEGELVYFGKCKTPSPFTLNQYLEAGVTF